MSFFKVPDKGAYINEGCRMYIETNEVYELLKDRIENSHYGIQLTIRNGRDSDGVIIIILKNEHKILPPPTRFRCDMVHNGSWPLNFISIRMDEVNINEVRKYTPLHSSILN